jgi:uncharacterized membrane protein YccC
VKGDGRPEPGARPLGLRLFNGDESARYRRRRRLFVALWIAVTLGLTVPVVPPVWSPRPFVLGLPTSFAWVIACLAVTFVALVWLYRSERREGD